ncbi:MAG: RNA methyltransferase [Ignavibacteriaceae bacterium]|nr:RNA methyltransferase [Ignavibacteriaceae bacterium]
MISKASLKYYSSLLQKKFRVAENKFLVEGKKLVLEGISSGYIPEIVLVSSAFKNNASELISDLLNRNILVEEVKDTDFSKIAETENPQGITAVFNKKDFPKYRELKTILKAGKNLIVFLDSVSDPGNLGTIIRNADWFGILTIVLNKNCVEVFNPKVIRSSMGSVFHVDIFEQVDESTFFEDAKKHGYKLVISTLDGVDVFTFEKRENYIIALHNESHGAGQMLRETADYKIKIPQKGKAESLNVASASAVIFSEFTK